MDQYDTYIMISAQGVTEFVALHPGEEYDPRRGPRAREVTFYPLFEWVDALFCFCRVKQIGIFARYPLWHIFRQWSQMTRLQKFTRR